MVSSMGRLIESMSQVVYEDERITSMPPPQPSMTAPWVEQDPIPAPPNRRRNRRRSRRTVDDGPSSSQTNPIPFAASFHHHPQDPEYSSSHSMPMSWPDLHVPAASYGHPPHIYTSMGQTQHTYTQPGQSLFPSNIYTPPPAGVHPTHMYTPPGPSVQPHMRTLTEFGTPATPHMRPNFDFASSSGCTVHTDAPAGDDDGDGDGDDDDDDDDDNPWNRGRLRPRENIRPWQCGTGGHYHHPPH